LHKQNGAGVYFSHMKNILFFGDSLTAGYGLADVRTESCPALIQQKIDAEGLDYHVINGGLSGDTSAGGLTRLEYWLNRPMDVFILELGINDMMRRIPPVKIHHNLESIILEVKVKYPQIKLALMGMELPAFIPGAATAEFRAIYRKLADKYQMAFVPFYLEGIAGQRHLNMRDGLHPSAAGYRVIADKIWPVIKPLLLDEGKSA
jgi:acyl-CoA thioesterase-1